MDPRESTAHPAHPSTEDQDHPHACLNGYIYRGLKESPVRLPGGEELVLSISVGACRYAGEDDIRELLAKADAAMYEAKREGRAWVLAG